MSSRSPTLDLEPHRVLDLKWAVHVPVDELGRVERAEAPGDVIDVEASVCVGDGRPGGTTCAGTVVREAGAGEGISSVGVSGNGWRVPLRTTNESLLPIPIVLS